MSVTSDPPPAPQPEQPRRQRSGIRFRAVNLLLLVPLVVLVTPLFNAAEPALFGMPFFYWFQFAVIPLGIACTVAVHLLTRHVDEEGSS